MSIETERTQALRNGAPLQNWKFIFGRPYFIGSHLTFPCKFFHHCLTLRGSVSAFKYSWGEHLATRADHGRGTRLVHQNRRKTRKKREDDGWVVRVTSQRESFLSCLCFSFFVHFSLASHAERIYGSLSRQEPSAGLLNLFLGGMNQIWSGADFSNLGNTRNLIGRVQL